MQGGIVERITSYDDGIIVRTTVAEPSRVIVRPLCRTPKFLHAADITDIINVGHAMICPIGEPG